MSTFPERLKGVRKQLGLTQEQLGEELNVTKASISAWENGREAPGFRLLPRLRKVLGVSLDELICGESASGRAADSGAKSAVSARNADEVRILKLWRKLAVKRRKALLDLLD